MLDQQITSASIKRYSSGLERCSWTLLFFSLLTQLSTIYSFPSYNVALAFWGCFTAFTKHGRACFGLISFCFISLILDVVFCSINYVSSNAMWDFCLSMFVICMFVKAYCLYVSSHLFTALGGATSMEASNNSYDSFMSNSAIYYPANNSNISNPLSDNNR